MAYWPTEVATPQISSWIPKQTKPTLLINTPPGGSLISLSVWGHVDMTDRIHTCRYILYTHRYDHSLSSKSLLHSSRGAMLPIGENTGLSEEGNSGLEWYWRHRINKIIDSEQWKNKFNYEVKKKITIVIAASINNKGKNF